MASYTELKVWQVSMDLVQSVYGLTRRFPREELYGLTGQMRRAAVSSPSNIAEGYGREQKGFIAHSLRVALGSTRELETQLLIALRLKYLVGDDLSPARQQCDEVGKMLRGLIRSVEGHD